MYVIFFKVNDTFLRKFQTIVLTIMFFVYLILPLLPVTVTTVLTKHNITTHIIIIIFMSRIIFNDYNIFS